MKASPSHAHTLQPQPAPHGMTAYDGSVLLLAAIIGLALVSIPVALAVGLWRWAFGSRRAIGLPQGEPRNIWEE